MSRAGLCDARGYQIRGIIPEMENKENKCTLSVRDLTFAYEADRPVLDGISFDVAPGEAVGLIGANGVGKSTLLKLLVGLEMPQGGEILYRKEDAAAGEQSAAAGTDGRMIRLAKDTLAQIRRRVGYVFQDSESQLFLTTVEEDVAFAPRNYGYPEEEVQRRVTDALTQVRAEHLRRRSIHKLSGGEKKQVSIATILATGPELVLLDEPSIALDPANRRNLIRVLNDLPGAKLIASHDLDLVRDVCERTILMHGGRIIKDGRTDEILCDRALLESNGL